MKRYITILIAIFLFFSGRAQVDRDDSLALVNIYNNTGGSDWTNNSGWLNTDVAQWYGVTVRDSYVVALELPDNNMRGVIDFDYTEVLVHIEKLDFSGNENLYLTPGTSISWFSKLKKLSYLDLSYTALGLEYLTLYYDAPMTYFAAAGKNLSSIPSTALVALKNLVYCDISDNKFTSIPEELLQSGRLVTLKASNNEITSIDTAGNATNLKQLYLDGNQLTDFGGILYMKNLDYLNLYNNELSDGIEVLADSVPGIDTLILGFNRIVGSIDQAAAQWTNIKYLDISTNNISGDVSSLFELKDLKVLIANDNNLHGTLDSLYKLDSLQYLNLAGDSISGNLPANAMTSLQDLEVLLLNNNLITGTIPKETGNMSKLKQINLSQNNLQGPIPDELWSLPDLEYVNLSNNGLQGQLNDSIGNAQNLKYLLLASNKFQGILPDTITSLSQLKTLDISHNFFDSLPHLADLPDLGHLYVQNNFLDLRSLWQTGLSLTNDDFVFMPQNRFPVDTLDQGTDVRINAPLRSAPGYSVSYAWFNQGETVAGADTSFLTVSKQDTGAYYCVMKVVLSASPLKTAEFVTLPYVSHIAVKNGIASDEYDALENFYNSTGGDNWDDRGFWLTDTNVEYWKGITLTAGIHVEDINMENNSLSGSVPDLSALTYLRNLDIAFNQLDTVADLNSSMLYSLNLSGNYLTFLPKLPVTLQKMNVSGNKLEFDDLEGVKDQCPNLLTFVYWPQRKVGDYKILAPVTGSRVVLDVPVGGSQNVYTWYKDGDSIYSSTDSKYVIESFQFADTGVYHCEVTNNLLPQLTLVSNDILIIKAYTVWFEVSDTAGMPVSNVEVLLSGYQPVYTDEQGLAKVDFVKEAKNLSYTLERDGYHKVRGVVDVIGSDVMVDTQMYPVVLDLHFYDDLYLPTKNLDVYLYGDGGNLVDMFNTGDSGRVVYYPLLNGTYVMNAYQSPFNEVSDTFTVNLSDVRKTYFFKLANFKNIQLYPNPTQGQVTVFTVEPQDSVQINLYNYQGFLLWSKKYYDFRKTQITLPPSLPTGHYMIEVKNATIRRVIPVILLR